MEGPMVGIWGLRRSPKNPSSEAIAATLEADSKTLGHSRRHRAAAVANRGDDYFTKWIEAEPLTTISSARVRRFVEVNIITRFGAPWNTAIQRASEAANKVILDGLKKRIFGATPLGLINYLLSFGKSNKLLETSTQETPYRRPTVVSL
ncbi:hypothetical protein K1719_018501 [Acacia pycnantha]|nr:hypothetical protein K1719_018501 [Acacia pycnantha]